MSKITHTFREKGLDAEANKVLALVSLC